LSRLLLLLGLLLETGRHEECRELLEANEAEPFAEWSFGELLLAIQTGASEEDRLQLLKDAHDVNPHVIDYLLDRRPMPSEQPPYFQLDDTSGAIFCVAHLRKAWASTPGAISWLRQAASKADLLEPLDPDEIKSEFDPTLRDLFAPESFELPPHPEPVWLAGIHELPAVHRKGRKRKKKVWALYAFGENGPIGCEILEQRPNAHELWEWLLETMRQGEEPGRPEQIAFPQKGICRQLRTEAIRVGVNIEVCEDPPPLEPMFEKLTEQLNWDGRDDDVSDDEILALPQDATDVWQCDVFPLEERLIDDQGELRRAISILVASARDDLILAQDLSTTESDNDTLLRSLQQAMMIPLAGEPHRPGEVVVRHEDDRLQLQEPLDRWNINISTSPVLDVADRMHEEMSGLIKKRGPGGLHTAGDITNEDREVFYEAAARLFRDRPWERWPEDALIRIDCDAIPVSPVYVLVMGQSGLETGLSIFEDRTIPERLFGGEGPEAMREVTGYSLTFEEEQAVPLEDLDAIEQFGWPIATPEAHPVPFRINDGPDFAPPSRAELQMLTALMDGVGQLAPGAGDPVTTTCGDVSVTCANEGRAR